MFRRCATRLGVQKLQEPMPMPDAHTQIRGQRSYSGLRQDQAIRGGIAVVSLIWALTIVLRHTNDRSKGN